MKLKIVSAVLFVVMVANAFAQNTVELKPSYKPNKKYKEQIEQINQVTLNYKGPKKALDKIKAAGLKNPTKSSSETNMQAILTTGKLGDDKHFPVKMKFTNVRSSSGSMEQLKGAEIFGSATINEAPKMDSISAADMDAKTRAAMLKSMQNIFDQVGFDHKTLKVGESYVKEQPLTIPVGGSKLSMTIKTTYKLKSIENGMANFEIKAVYVFNTKIEDNKISGTGKGTGTMTYDIANGFYTNFKLDAGLQMTMKIEEIELVMSMKTGMNQNISIVSE